MIPVNAQNGPTLAVEPPIIGIPLGSQVQLNLEVQNGEDVNGFDILVNYDTQGLLLISWEHGDFLTDPSCSHEVDQPGVFELACSQNNQPGVDGDGILLKLTFDTLSTGFPDVTITEATFIKSGGELSYPERRNGRVGVINAPTYTQTATITSTPTPTFTPTVSSSPTLAPTEAQMETSYPGPTAIITDTATTVPTGTALISGTATTPPLSGGCHSHHGEHPHFY